MKTSPCRKCGAPMVWVTMDPSGKKNPLDPEPTTAGRVVFIGDPESQNPRARSLKKGEAATSETFVSHFATCPNADEFKPERRGYTPEDNR